MPFFSATMICTNSRRDHVEQCNIVQSNKTISHTEALSRVCHFLIIIIITIQFYLWHCLQVHLASIKIWIPKKTTHYTILKARGYGGPMYNALRPLYPGHQTIDRLVNNRTTRIDNGSSKMRLALHLLGSWPVLIWYATYYKAQRTFDSNTFFGGVLASNINNIMCIEIFKVYCLFLQFVSFEVVQSIINYCLFCQIVF